MTIKDDLIAAYQNLLIKQYFEKPKAKAEIGATVAKLGEIAEVVEQFVIEFDLDEATGDRLDKIGKIVGINRIVSSVVPRIRFGFDGNPNARGFADRFDANRVSAPFQDRFEQTLDPTELGDVEYRFFIKAKVAVNTTSAYMIAGGRISIQDVIQTAFDGRAFVTDRKDMKLNLYIAPEVEALTIAIIQELNLLPSGQAVGYNLIQADINKSFGFSGNPIAAGFADRFDSGRPSGPFARKII